MRKDDQQLIKEIIIKNNLLTAGQLAQLENEQKTTGKNFTEIIEEKKLIPEEIFTKIKSKVYNVPFVDLRGKKITSEILALVPEEIAKNYQIMAFRKVEDEVGVAMANPQNYLAISALDFIARKSKVHFNFFIATRTDIQSALRYYDDLKEEVKAAMGSAAAETETTETTQLPAAGESGVNTDQAVKTAPVSKMVNVILRNAIDGKASDIHIEPVGQETRVRYRVDGELHTSIVLPKNVHNAIVARIKVLANLKLDETRLPQDGRFRVNMDNRNVDFRVSAMPLFDQEKVVIRILDNSANIQDLAKLGFSGRNLELITRYIQQPSGMFLVTGPTGSGKSTTLYALLNLLNKEGVNIITLEDPIEYYIAGVNQTQIRPEIDLTFARGLRSILRQDPDVIMVGEVRDNETAELAVHASLTGHIVLSTLHTNDATGAIPRLIDMKVEPFLVSSALNIIVAQRLVRMICQYCREEVKLTPGIQAEMARELEALPSNTLPASLKKDGAKFYRGRKCSRCENSGYKGRIAIVEVLEVNDRMKQMIIDGRVKNNTEMAAEIKQQQMISMKVDGILKAMAALTTIEEVFSVTKD